MGYAEQRRTIPTEDVLEGLKECKRGFDQAISEGPSVLEILLELQNGKSK